MDAAAEESGWRALVRRQHGAVTSAQLREVAITRAEIRAHLQAQRWQVPIPGIFVTFTGPLPSFTQCWVALLHAGSGAVLSHTTAGTLWGVVHRQPLLPIHVTIPRQRCTRSRRGLIIHRALRPPESVGEPPRTRIAATALALCGIAKHPSEVTALLARVGQKYPEALEEAVGLAKTCRNLRWRAEVLAAARDVAEGAHSALERLYLVDVERAHGLPVGLRQREVGAVFQDVYYDKYATTAELDGRTIHETAEAIRRDKIRDRLAIVRGEVTLRYGWDDVRYRPCAVAAEMATVLRARGWPGDAQPCSAGCQVGRASA